MKNLIKSLVAVVVLAGATSAEELSLNTANLGSMLEATAAVSLPEVKAVPASLTWKAKGDKYMAVAKGEGLPEIVVKVKGTKADITVDGQKMTYSIKGEKAVFEYAGDTIVMQSEKNITYNGKPVAFTTYEGDKYSSITFGGLVSKYLYKNGDVVLTGNLTTENIRIASCFVVANFVLGMMMSQA